MYGLTEQDAASYLGDLPAATGPRAGFSGAFSAGYEQMTYTGSEWSDYALMAPALKERADQIEKLTGQRIGNTMPFLGYDDVVAGRRVPVKGGMREDDWLKSWQEAQRQEQEIERLRATYPALKTRSEIEADVRRKAQEIETETARTNSNLTLMGHVGALAGSLAGSFVYNPRQTALNIITAPMVGLGGTAATVAANMVKNGLISAGVTAAGEFGGGGVQQTREALGLSHSTEDALKTVAMAGLGGAVVQGGLEGLTRGAGVAARTVAPAVQKAGAQVRPLVQRFRREMPDPLPVEQVAADVLERTLEEARVVMPKDTSGEARVAAALARDEPLPELPLPTLTPADARVVRPDLVEMSARDLNVDAARFQFKGGGDDAGVTSRLKGVTRWNPDLGGTLIAFQDKDGKLFVADGHQRVGLAQRLLDTGAHDDIRLPVRVLKEVDGFTPERAMVYAAGKNIAEGTGDVLDAARVMRTAPQWLPELPRNSALVRTATDLARVDDHVFRLTLNDKLRPEFAALIGKLEPNPAYHMALADVLMKADPDTLFQADTMLRQARAAGFTEGVQGTLFGDEWFATSLFRERAKVLERSLRLLKEDVKTFKTLTTRAETILNAGNSLNDAANASRLTGTEAVMAVVSKLANVKGDISDALNKAARDYARTGQLGKSANGFLATLRSAYDDGRLFSGLSDGLEGAVPQPAGQGAAGALNDTLTDTVALAEKDAVAAPEQAQKVLDDLGPPAAKDTVTDASSPVSSPEPETPALFSPEDRDLLNTYGLPDGVQVADDGTVRPVVHTADTLVQDVADDEAVLAAMRGCLL